MNFRNLQVWQKSKALAVAVYAVCRTDGLARDFGLRDQMQRSAVSIPSNIAEGYSRDSDKDRCHFLTIARGSCAELSTQLEIAKDSGLLSADQFILLEPQCDEIARMLIGLSKSIRRAPN